MPATYLGDFAAAFVTLIVVVEPMGLAPIFLAATAGHDEAERAGIAGRACGYALLILIGSALGGEALLRAIGITLPAFRIAGGLLLFSIASEMVLGVRIGRDAASAVQAAGERSGNIAAFPLAIPLMAGPGAIAATLLIAGEAHGAPARLVALIGAIVAVISICWAVCRLATRVERLIGASASVVMERWSACCSPRLRSNMSWTGQGAFLPDKQPHGCAFVSNPRRRRRCGLLRFARNDARGSRQEKPVNAPRSTRSSAL